MIEFEYPITDEQQCLIEFATIAWNKLELYEKYDFPCSEETITEWLLMLFKTRYPGNIEIIPLSKSAEAKLGADWIWSFSSWDGKWSITMLVQAKRILFGKNTYRGIRRTIGKAKPAKRQIESLIENARRLNDVPIYLFYNYISDKLLLPDRCRLACLSSLEQITSWGVSVPTAQCVKSVLPNESFQRQSVHSIPLHCILCTGGTGLYGPFGTPGIISKELTALSAASASSDFIKYMPI